MKNTITLSADEVAALITDHLKKKGLRVEGKVRFSGTIKYGGDNYSPDISPVFTGATVTATTQPTNPMNKRPPPKTAAKRAAA